MAMTKIDICPICKNSMEGKVIFKNARGQEYCWDCEMNKVSTKKFPRQQRAYEFRQDILEKKRDEIKQIIAERTKCTTEFANFNFREPILIFVSIQRNFTM